MEPMLHRGDLAVIREESTYRVGDVVLYNSPRARRERAAPDRPRPERPVRGQGRQQRFPRQRAADRRADRRQALAERAVRSAGSRTGCTRRRTRRCSSGWRRSWRWAAAPASALARRRRNRPAKRLLPSALRGRRASPSAIRSRSGRSGRGRALRRTRHPLVHRPVTVTEPVAEAYVHQGRFEYSASVRRNAVYPDGRVTTGEPIFLRLVPRLSHVRVPARGGTARSGDGRIRLDARLSDGRGWERLVQLAPERSFRARRTSPSAARSTSARCRHSSRTSRRLTGSSPGSYTLTLLPRVTVSGKAGRDPIDATFAPALPFDLADLRLQPNLRRRGRAWARSRRARRAAERMSPPSTRARRLVAAGAHGTATLADRTRRRAPARSARARSSAPAVPRRGARTDRRPATASSWFRFDRARRSGLERPISPTSTAWSGSPSSSERMIFHFSDGGEHSYVVEDGGSVFRYRTKAAPVHVPPPPRCRRRFG